MKIYLFIMMFPIMSLARLNDGTMRYTIQVSSESSYSKASSKMGLYRDYGYPHIFEKTIKCEECPNKIKTVYRLYIDIFKDLEEAKNSLKIFKKENPNKFKDSIVQILVE